MLFFPTTADYESGHLRPPIDGQWFDKYSLPRLRNVDIGIKVDTRRPMFLSSLNDQEYVAVWKNMSANKEMTCPTW